MGRAITVMGKGGSGKTTVSVLLGTALAERGKKTLLIDASLGLRGLDLPLGLENEIFNHLADVLLDRCAPEEAILGVPACPGLFLLPAAQAKVPLDVSPFSMKILVRHLKEEYDFILIDAAAGVERGFSMSAAGAQEAILVLSTDRASVRAATRFSALLGEEGLHEQNLFFNRLEAESIGGPDMEEAGELLGSPVIGAAAEDPLLARAINRGSIFEEGSREWMDPFRRAAGRLMGEEIPPETPPARKGFHYWQSLFRK